MAMDPFDTSWCDKYAGKLKTLPDAMRLIKPGKRIYLSDGSATPLGLIPGLVDPQAVFGDNEIIHMMTLGDAPYTQPQYASRFRHNAVFIGSNVRQAVQEGRADYTPVFLSEIPSLIRSGRIPIDVALISVTPPDENGYCNFGTHVDLAPAVIEVAEIIIVQVNPLMPWVNSSAKIHVDNIDAMVLAPTPLPLLPTPPDRPETAEIARNVAELIPDGATIQVGIGSVPNAILRHLVDRKDLGVHTEMFSDGVIDLVERGVINGAKKTLNRGKIVSSFIMGTKRCYDFINRNPMIETYPVDYTNDPFIIAQHDNMAAINTGLEVDLTGQVCADSIGTRFYSGIGGQVDFIRGAARSKGGIPVIIIQSTAKNGTISRIVPRLSRGAGVVTTRGDVHWVVTEFGSVNLHGLNVRERALALISIAHPRFRSWLLAEAKQSHFVYMDQMEPPMETPLYPKRWEMRETLRDGARILLRPVKPMDESLLRKMFYRLSEETVYKRFCGVVKYMPHEDMQHFCTVDYDRRMTLVATVSENGVERAIGVTTYDVNAHTRYAEVGMLVDDEFQNRGVGKLLMKELTQLAKAHDVLGFTAYTVGFNSPMMRLFEYTGHAVKSTPEDHGFAVRVSFERASTESGGESRRPLATAPH